MINTKWTLIPILSLMSLNLPYVYADGDHHTGGGFYENSRFVLKAAAWRLATKIRTSTPSLVSSSCHYDYPFTASPPPCVPNPGVKAWIDEGWTNEKMAEVIENVRIEPNTPSLPRPGTDEPLLFNFGTDQKGPYIVALHDYFSSFESVAPTVYYDDPKSLRVIKDPLIEREIADVELRLLHEFSHLLGGLGLDNDNLSKVFATEISNRTTACQSVALNDSFEGALLFVGMDKTPYDQQIFKDKDWDAIQSPRSMDEFMQQIGGKKITYQHTEQYNSFVVPEHFSLSANSTGIEYLFKANNKHTDFPHLSDVTLSGKLATADSGLVGTFNQNEISMKIAAKHLLITRITVKNACGDSTHSYKAYIHPHRDNE